MSDFWLYFNQGLYHVIDWTNLEHILFLILICAAYSFSDWKRILIVITVFTLANFLSILLAAYNVVSVSRGLILFLIPFIIVITAFFNLFTAGKEKQMESLGVLYIAGAFYGFIHGMVYHGILSSSPKGKNFLSLLEYSLGIEIGQVIVAIAILFIGLIFQSIFRFNKRDWVLVLSALVIGILIPNLIETWRF